jgi:AAA domain
MSDENVTDIGVRLDREVMPIEWLSDIKPNLTGAWRIKGLLPRTGLACIYGASGSGKTFLALDIACHIATGKAWGDRKTDQGVVIYIAAESPASLNNRASLWRDANADTDIPLGIIPRTLNLKDANADLPLLIEWLTAIEKEHGPIAAIVVDTLARSMGGGDENLAKDMGGVIASCDKLREAFKTLVVLVHHTGKNEAAGARGSSSLRAGVDTEIEVTDNDGWHRASWEKQRDGPIGFYYEFKLEPHVIGEDEDGDEVTSCLVVDLKYVGEKQKKATRISPAQKVALDALSDLLDQPCNIASNEAMGTGAKVGQTVGSVDAWRQLCYDRDVSDKTQGAKQKAFKRTVEGLQAKHKVQVYQDEVWLAD